MLVLTCRDGEHFTITVPAGEAPQVFDIHVKDTPGAFKLVFDAPRTVDVKLHRRPKVVANNAPLGKRRAPR